MNIFKNRGFSLVELMVGLTILITVVGLLTQLGTVSRGRALKVGTRECENIVTSTMNNIKRLGYEYERAEIRDGVIRRGGVNLPGVPTGMTWPNGNLSATGTSGSGETYFNSHRSIVGSMRFLNDLYNSDTDYCTLSTGRSLPTNITGYYNGIPANSAAAGRINNLNLTIRIQAYNLVNGNRSCPAIPTHIRPIARRISNENTFRPASEDLDGVTSPPNTRQNLGFEVMIHGTYDDVALGSQRCAIRSRFQYPRMPAVSDAYVGSATIDSPSPAALACNPDRKQGRFTLTRSNNWSQDGIVFMCRDSSVVHPGHPTGNCAPPAPQTEAFTTNPNWVLCEQVTLCGRPVVSSTYNTDDVVNTYDEIPWGCQPEIQVRAISASGDTTENEFNSSVTSGLFNPPPCLSCDSACPPVVPNPYCGTQPSICTDGSACSGGPTGTPDGGGADGGGDGADGGDGPGGGGAGGGGSADGSDGGF